VGQQVGDTNPINVSNLRIFIFVSRVRMNAWLAGEPMVEWGWGWEEEEKLKVES
jgi:hypothetical protein